MKRVRTDVNLTNLGVLTMSSVVSGYNPVLDARRTVNLNYRHEENVSVMAQSAFGSNLEALAGKEYFTESGVTSDGVRMKNG